MKTLFDNKWFVGAVDFYDHRKGFGYVAAAGASSYYIDDSSFVEPGAKAEKGIVVFQAARQDDGKTRAINVRKLKKQDEDYSILLERFPSNGLIKFKKDGVRDIFPFVSKIIPRPLFIERLCMTIENNDNRTPLTTFGLFQYFVNLFAKKGDRIGTSWSGVRTVSDYVFDRDFDKEDKEDKEAWDKMFSIFTTPECLAILKQYPTTCKYIADEAILKEFVETTLDDECSEGKLYELNSCLPYLPETVHAFAKSRIEEIADKRIIAALNECALNDRTDEKLINEKTSWFLKLTSKTYEKEKADCLAQVKLRKFFEKKERFEQIPWDYNVRKNFFGAFEELGTAKELQQPTVIETLEKAIPSCAEKGEMRAVNELIQKLTEDYSRDKGSVAVQTIKSIVKDYLRVQAEAFDQIEYSAQSKYFDEYLMLVSMYEGEDREELRREVASALQNATTIRPFMLSMEKGCGLFTADEAFVRVTELVNGWGAEEIKNFTYNPVVIKDDQRFAEVILDKVFEWVEPRKIKDYYWGEDSNSYHSEYYSQNCRFLEEVKDLCQEANLQDKWDAFLLTRDSEELIELHRNDVLDRLTDRHIKIVVDSIGLSSVQSKYMQWYYAPSLVNQEVILGLCKRCGHNVFLLFAERLVSLDLSEKNNIYLAVLLTELLSMDRPDKKESSYSYVREWETTFTRQLQELKNNNSNNKRLSTILWAVHHQTSTSLDTLSEIFAYLPPYVQIKSVKKLFQLIAQGKINHTAESLYNTINKGDGEICLPLEIVFEYLKLRESNPSAVLTHERMLQLLDGRNDHREWIGVSDLMNGCGGRYSIRDDRYSGDDSWNNRYRSDYYNGKMSDATNGVVVFVPRKMITEGGQNTEYNNKYFQSIQELIRISFEEGDYRMTENSDRGVVYLFKPEKKIELFGVARAYNFNYGKPMWARFERSEINASFCECRLSNKLDKEFHIAFNWCGNKPCFCPPLRFHVDLASTSEWEDYTVLDFMRILHIPIDYVNAEGKRTKYGYYIILSSYLNSFEKFYEHLKCRGCGQLMKPEGVSNFAFRAVTQFACADENCEEYGKTVYLNHCFNTTKCNATIDSRDSKKCPNGQYICPECGACCSTENYRRRIDNLRKTGGEISNWLMDFVNNNRGHWERNEYYCYKCGVKFEETAEGLHCPVCQSERTTPVYKSIRPTLEN